nr:MAG TPA: hypothetical protein [Caudoviricetes sp.]
MRDCQRKENKIIVQKSNHQGQVIRQLDFLCRI